MAGASNIEEIREGDYELEVHEHLYRNIFVLTLKHSTTKDFKACFKMDMFINNNKTAFQHVIHFLLNVYDPVKFKENIIWPILDSKMEAQFRNQVMKYINEIRNLHENSGIPHLMTSHLISPGGFKFTDFMFRLSTFILFEKLNRDEITNPPLLRPKADADDKIFSGQLKNLEAVVNKQFKILAHKQMEFEKENNNTKKILSELKKQKAAFAGVLYDTKDKLKQSIDSSEKDLKEETILEKEETNTEMMTEIEDIMKHVAECSDLIDILSRDRESNESIDFLETMKKLRDILDTNRHIIYKLQNNNMPKYLKTILQLHQDSTSTFEKSTKLVSYLKEYLAKLEQVVSNPVNDIFEKNSVLSHRVNEIFKPLDFMNCNTTN